MVNAIFAYQKTGGVNNSGNLAFIMFALYIFTPQYLFATYYLQGASLCNFMLSVTFVV